MGRQWLVQVQLEISGVGFDDGSFSTEAFDTGSWWFNLVETSRRYIFKVSSKLTKMINVISGIH